MPQAEGECDPVRGRSRARELLVPSLALRRQVLWGQGHSLDGARSRAVRWGLWWAVGQITAGRMDSCLRRNDGQGPNRGELS